MDENWKYSAEKGKVLKWTLKKNYTYEMINVRRGKRREEREGEG